MRCEEALARPEGFGRRRAAFASRGPIWGSNESDCSNFVFSYPHPTQQPWTPLTQGILCSHRRWSLDPFSLFSLGKHLEDSFFVLLSRGSASVVRLAPSTQSSSPLLDTATASLILSSGLEAGWLKQTDTGSSLGISRLSERPLPSPLGPLPCHVRQPGLCRR